MPGRHGSPHDHLDDVRRQAKCIHHASLQQIVQPLGKAHPRLLAFGLVFLNLRFDLGTKQRGHFRIALLGGSHRLHDISGENRMIVAIET